MPKVKGTIFDIQRFSLHDGPGVRTTVFFKGCNLRCAWCHNPESQAMGNSLQHYPQKCIGCGVCLTRCPTGAIALRNEQWSLDRGLCSVCGTCAEECYAGALTISGKTYTVDEVIAVVLRDQPFYAQSGGGMTTSGGEAMLQIDFLEQLLKRAKDEGLHTVVDTAGHVPFSSFERVMPYTDKFLFDIKAISRDVHMKWIGVKPDLIHENLRKLCEHGARVVARVPVIPDVNDSDSEIEGIARLAKSAGVVRIELLNYHNLGEGKYASLGVTNPMPIGAKPLSKDRLAALRDIAHTASGLRVVFS